MWRARDRRGKSSGARGRVYGLRAIILTSSSYSCLCGCTSPHPVFLPSPRILEGVKGEGWCGAQGLGVCSIQGQGSGGLGNLLSRSEVAGRVSKRVSSEWEIKGSVVTIFIVFIDKP